MIYAIVYRNNSVIIEKFIIDNLNGLFSASHHPLNQHFSLQVGVRGKTAVVLCVEKKSVAKLQEDRTVRKICLLDHHVVMAFAGLTADARILINRAQIECQSHKLNVEDPVTIEYITRYIAQLKQKYTQSNGRRPFGLSCLIGGFDMDGTSFIPNGSIRNLL